MIDLLAWRTAFGNWLETSKVPAYEAIEAIEVAATLVDQSGLDAGPLWQLATKARQARSRPFSGIRMALRQQGVNIDDSRLPELFEEACRLASQAASLGTAAEQTAADLPEQGRTEPNEAEPTGDNAENLRGLTAVDRDVLVTMASFDPRDLLSIARIVEHMPPTERRSDESVRTSVKKLIGTQLAERPEGRNSGARLTLPGRQLAGKIEERMGF